MDFVISNPGKTQGELRERSFLARASTSLDFTDFARFRVYYEDFTQPSSKGLQ